MGVGAVGLLVAVVAWWLLRDGGASGASDAGDRSQPLDAVPAAAAGGKGGIPGRRADPAGTLRVPDVDPTVLEEAREHVLAPQELRLERPEDARAFAALTVGPAGAMPQIAACWRRYFEVTGAVCTVNLVGRFQRIEDDPNGRSRLVALEPARPVPARAAVADELGPATDAGRAACRKLERCLADAALGAAFDTPHDMRGVEAWSSHVPMDMAIRTDHGFYQPGEDLGTYLDELLDGYRDAQPWLRDGTDVGSLDEAGRAYCREKYAEHGPEAEPLVSMCMSNVPMEILDYLRVRELRRLVEP